MKNRKIKTLCLCMLLVVGICGCKGNERDEREGMDNMTEQGENMERPEQDTAESVILSKTDGGKISTYDGKADYELAIDAKKGLHEVSDTLFGIFFEDINFAADGGLYAEMVKNRSFEFTKLAKNGTMHGWDKVGDVETVVIEGDEETYLNINNPNYLVITNSESGKTGGVANAGFLDGMSIEEKKKYKFSVWAKGCNGYTGPVYAELTVGNESVSYGCIEAVSDVWKKYELDLTSSKTASKNVKLRLTIPEGSVAVDMVSLFPEDTYKGRENGLRKDLAERLEALNPSFLRFPGGCVIEGRNITEAYDWKNSIGVDENGDPLFFNGTYGDVAARKMGQNIWTDNASTNDANPSYMTYGLGFYEFFLLAEDLGASPVPVVNCGMYCQARGSAAVTLTGNLMKKYIQDALDLVEFCRGDETTKWGKVRIAMGHEEPFDLHYIGIGNEQWGQTFYDHYDAFVEAFEQAKKEDPEMYGGIELIYSAGTDDGDSGAGNYRSAYYHASDWLDDNDDKVLSDFAGAVDHHYYNSPNWFLSHTDYYDPENYSRDNVNFMNTLYAGGIKVFLGEYAAQSNTWKAALSEAAYMTGLERNSDIVVMAAYAPLFGNLTKTHWAPDLIWFNNHQSTASVNYYVQQVFAKNVGTEVLGSSLSGAEAETAKLAGKVGVGTWETAAKFDNIKITDNVTGTVLAEENFDSDDSFKTWTKVSDGKWSVTSGELVQSSSATNTSAYANTGTAAYFGDVNWEEYTYELDATKTSGAEGFLIPFAVRDKGNNYFWNIGGWGNTVSCLQQVSDSSKSDQIAGTTKNCTIKSNQTYHLKIVVNKTNVKCYIDDKLMIDHNIGASTTYDAYQVVSTDGSGDLIVKLVNVTADEKTFGVKISGADNIIGTGTIDSVAGTSSANDNILGKDPVVTLKSYEVTGITDEFNLTVPKLSVTVLRIKTK